jgi:hypothetical protein
MILARVTMKYGNVYFPARRESSFASASDSTISYGLFLGMGNLLGCHHAMENHKWQHNTLVYL